MRVSYDVKDRLPHDRYIEGVVPLLEKHSAEVLVADHDGCTLEGARRSVCVVLKFRSKKAALAPCNDPAYGLFRKIRLDFSENTPMALVKELRE